MNKETNKLIPELRFPEFVNDKWEEKLIGNIFNSFSGGTPNTSEKEYYNGNIPFIRSAEINKEKTELFLSDLGLKNSSAKIVEKGDLLVALYGANSGDSAISKINGAINQAVLCLKSEFSNVFTHNYLTYRKNWIISKFVQGGQGNLSGDIVKSLSIPFPEKPTEQKKIADCLSSLDELITAHTDKLETLKTYKKGLMQNLFPQEGEKVPKLRFKEFEKDGEWEEEILGNLGTFLGGGTPERSNPEYWKGNIPWISSSDVNEDDIHNISITRFINENSIKESATKIIPKGSVLFISRVGVGKLAINNEEVCTSQDFTNFIPERVLNYFIGYYFIENKNLLQSLTQGTSIKGFSKGDLENFKLCYPENKKEQQRIADTLSFLDNLIKEQSNKTEQLKSHKKGLMQGLFPKARN
ncbi:restriction endonuclease subunit S [Flavobacterium sp. F52]|uniref:restriction endonuclease subunit S n=1 Tax=Flavobacterium sp. F52 TaxID=1202532 RepID=UPI000272D846|nr:restriction endonuclease subunit S [Flavobacterium sp. F52]EJG03541.1 HsdS specificity protein of type I restriction-modification system [Flavobacterium sp. F52]